MTVSNALGSVTSEPATLAVLKAARVTFDRAVYLQTKGSGETVVPVTVRRVVGTAEAVSAVVAVDLAMALQAQVVQELVETAQAQAVHQLAV